MVHALHHDLLCSKDFPLIPSQYARVTEMLKSRRTQTTLLIQFIILALWVVLIAHPDLLGRCLAKVMLAPAVMVMVIPLVSVLMAARIAPDEPSNAQRPYLLLTLLCQHFTDYYILITRWAELAEAVAIPAPALFVRRLLPVVFTCCSGSFFCAIYFGPPSTFWVAARYSLAFNGIFRSSCTLFLCWVEAPAFYPPCNLSFAGAMCLSLSFVLLSAFPTPDRRRAFAKRFPLTMSIRLSELQGAALDSHAILDSHTSDSLRSLDSCPMPRKWFRRIESSASSTTANSERSGMLPDHPSNGRSFIPWFARSPWQWEHERERQHKARMRKFPPSKAVRRPVPLGSSSCSSSWSGSDDSGYPCEVGHHTDGRSCVPRKLKSS